MKVKVLALSLLITQIAAMEKNPVVRLSEIAQLKADKMTDAIKNETKRLLVAPGVSAAIKDLHKIATNNANIIFLQLLRERENIDTQRVDDPLLQAILNNDYKAVREQLNQPYVSIDTQVEGDLIPLHFAAAQATNPQIFHALLQKMKEQGVLNKVNTQDIDGQTPLWFAAQRGNISAIRTLLQFGANPNIKSNDGQLPIDVAPKNKKKEIQKLIRRIKPTSSSSLSGRHR